LLPRDLIAAISAIEDGCSGWVAAGMGGSVPPVAIQCRSLIAAAAMLAAGPALAHKAPSGWSYPAECCAGIDCYEISEREVRQERDGWYVLATGEFFPLGWYRDSPDEHFHRCSANSGDRSAHTYCLFVPRLGS
jgi:hypothetical protein